mmetsp:Transcript_12812/g.53684  ORF Transcript_12812/g.53684 Transcript_12812/m.53684 type:complete len:483 (-) Transcript_12812:1286-2734(-)
MRHQAPRLLEHEPVREPEGGAEQEGQDADHAVLVFPRPGHHRGGHARRQSVPVQGVPARHQHAQGARRDTRRARDARHGHLRREGGQGQVLDRRPDAVPEGGGDFSPERGRLVHQEHAPERKHAAPRHAERRDLRDGHHVVLARAAPAGPRLRHHLGAGDAPLGAPDGDRGGRLHGARLGPRGEADGDGARPRRARAERGVPPRREPDRHRPRRRRAGGALRGQPGHRARQEGPRGAHSRGEVLPERPVPGRGVARQLHRRLRRLQAVRAHGRVQGARVVRAAHGLVHGQHHPAEQLGRFRADVLGSAQREAHHVPGGRQERGLGDVDLRRGMARAGHHAPILHGHGRPVVRPLAHAHRRRRRRRVRVPEAVPVPGAQGRGGAHVRRALLQGDAGAVHVRRHVRHHGGGGHDYHAVETRVVIVIRLIPILLARRFRFAVLIARRRSATVTIGALSASSPCARSPSASPSSRYSSRSQCYRGF